MPIKLTWTPPTEVGSGIIGYKLYKTLSPGPITPANFFQIFNGSTLAYDDYDYNRRLLEDQGYLYVLTSLNSDGESVFSLSNVVFVDYSFEDFLFLEEWESAFTGTDILEVFEEWDIVLPSIALQQYFEEWEYPLTLTLEYNESWDFTFPTLETQEYFEEWEYPLELSPVQAYIEPWEYAFSASILQYMETWEGTLVEVITEPWEYTPSSYSLVSEYIENWSP